MADTKQLSGFLENSGMPGQDWWNRANKAYQAVCQILLGDFNTTSESTRASPNPRISIFRIGNFACELSSRDELLACIIFGTIRTDLFLEVAWSNILGTLQKEGLKIKVFGISEKRLLLEVSGFTFKFQYIESPELVRVYPAIVDVPRAIQSNLQSDAEEAVEVLKDLEVFKEHIANLHLFRQLHFTLRLWMIACGIYESGQSFRQLTNQKPRIHCFDAELLRELSWKVSVSNGVESLSKSLLGMISDYLRLHLDCLRSPDKDECAFSSDPTGPFARSLSHNHFRTLHEEIERFYDALFARADTQTGTRNHDNALYETLQSFIFQPVSQTFQHETYVRVTMQYSGQSQVAGFKMMEFVRGKLLDLIRALENSLEDVLVRPWPTSLLETNSKENDNPYEGYWLLGISAPEASIRARVDLILSTWNDRTCSDFRYSRTTMVIQAELINQATMRLQDFKADPRKWPRPLAKPDPRYILDSVTEEAVPETALPVPPADRSSSPRKLRPAPDVLSRLKHDLSFDLDDYVIGYTDRHSGIMEKAVGEWVSESTEEEWIPQSRIQYFRRTSDGKRVWDRATKFDCVFK